MSEQEQTPVQDAQESIQQEPELTLEQLENIMQFKQQINSKLDGLYHEFCDFIRSLPVAPQLKSRALLHFDDGILWAHEAIRSAQLTIKPLTPDAPLSVQPEQPETDV